MEVATNRVADATRLVLQTMNVFEITYNIGMSRVAHTHTHIKFVDKDKRDKMLSIISRQGRFVSTKRSIRGVNRWNKGEKIDSREEGHVG